jgi:hypothetical protein
MERSLRPEEIPEGFSSADPTAGPGAGGDSNQAQAYSKEEQKRAVLEQALTPEALARLGTIKVCCIIRMIFRKSSFSFLLLSL